MIKEYVFKIKLLSDCCPGSGKSYGSAIDADIVYDNYGLPYIPAKRLKGCLLDAANDLVDLGMSIPLSDIFGSEGTQSTSLIIENAKLSNYDNYISEISSHKDLLKADSVLSCFTSERTQTSIGEDGSALENSLRTTRVINLDNEFICKFSLDENYINDFEKIVKTTHHIGLNKSRGLGEVNCTFIGECNEENTKLNFDVKNESYYILPIKIHNVSNLMFPDISDSQSKSLHYIPASSILGMLYERIGNERMSAATDNKEILAIKNGYISDQKNRYTPCPSSVVKIKNPPEATDEDKIDVKAYYNRAKTKSKDIGITSYITNTYISECKTMKPLMCMQSHTRINRVHGSVDGRNFYQFESIAANQYFMAEIICKGSFLKEIQSQFSNGENVKLGKSRGVEYGNCHIEFSTPIEYAPTENKSKKMLITFNSPVIVYNHNATVSSKISDIISYLEEKNGAEISVSETDMFLFFEDIGGFNATWKMSKPRYSVISRGTTLVADVDGIIKDGFIGERNLEGYGEYSVSPFESVEEHFYPEEPIIENSENDNNIGDLCKKVLFNRIEKEVQLEVISIPTGDFTATAIGKFLLITDEQETFENCKEQFEQIATNSKSQNILNLCKTIKSQVDGIVDKKAEEYNIDVFDNQKYSKDALYKIALETLLLKMKYAKRYEVKNNGEA